MIYNSQASMNNSNDDALYIKSAPSKKEWEGCWYRDYVGDILTGGEFGPHYSLKRIESSQKSDKEKKEMRDAFDFFFCGYKTIYLSNVIRLTHQQLQDFKDKNRHGTKLDLGKREDSWKTWDDDLKKQYLERM